MAPEAPRPVKGVHEGPPTGPILASLEKQIQATLAVVPPGDKTAVVVTAGKAGGNLVVAHRSEDGRWQAGAWVWVGKPDSWDADAGVFVKRSWK